MKLSRTFPFYPVSLFNPEALLQCVYIYANHIPQPMGSSINMKCFVLAVFVHLVLLCAIYKITCLTMPFTLLKEKANYLLKRMAFACMCVSFQAISFYKILLSTLRKCIHPSVTNHFKALYESTEQNVLI